MYDKNFLKICFENVQQKNPLVHCITNFVTVNDCANIVLAVGGQPTMAKHPGETAQVAARAAALVLNMGTVSEIDAMLNAGRSANEHGRPIILDPVGVASSDLRKKLIGEMSRAMRFSIIRGNASEIRYMATGIGGGAGVDASLEDRITSANAASFGALARSLAQSLGCVVSISGVIDIVADSCHAYAVHGGCYEMSRITGSGCMLTALMGAFAGANPDCITEAAITAQAVMNVSGELAKLKTDAAGGGTMTFRMHLIDMVSLMTPEILEEHARVEELQLCDI